MTLSSKSSGMVVIGLMALVVVIYRVIYIGIPIFMEGYTKGDMAIVLKSLTQLV